jgi:putative heme iron utilization protein
VRSPATRWPELLTDLSGHDALAETEPGAVAHMNEDHLDAVATLCHAPGSPRAWAAIATRVGRRAAGLSSRSGNRTRAELLTDLSGHDALAETEPGAVAHMNEDHLDAVALT